MLLFNALNLMTHDMQATLAFYRKLGVEISESTLWRTNTGFRVLESPCEIQIAIHLDYRHIDVVPGSVVYIPQRMVHGIWNRGSETLTLTWIFPTDNYAEIEYTMLEETGDPGAPP